MQLPSTPRHQQGISRSFSWIGRLFSRISLVMWAAFVSTTASEVQGRDFYEKQPYHFDIRMLMQTLDAAGPEKQCLLISQHMTQLQQRTTREYMHGDSGMTHLEWTWLHSLARDWKGWTPELVELFMPELCEVKNSIYDGAIFTLATFWDGWTLDFIEKHFDRFRNCKDHNGVCILQKLAYAWHSDFWTSDFLEQHFEDLIAIKDESGHSLLHTLGFNTAMTPNMVEQHMWAFTGIKTYRQRTTPLHYRAMHSKEWTPEYITRNIDVLTDTADRLGYTPLHELASHFDGWFWSPGYVAMNFDRLKNTKTHDGISALQLLALRQTKEKTGDIIVTIEGLPWDYTVRDFRQEFGPVTTLQDIVLEDGQKIDLSRPKDYRIVDRKIVEIK